MAKYDVFVSYHHADAPFVRELVRALKEHHLAVWYDGENVRTGESFMREIEDALEHSQFFLSVISPDYLSSQWAFFELGVAIGRDASSKSGTHVLPVLLRPAELPPQIKKYEIIDGTQLPVGRIATKVAEVVRQQELAS